MRKLPLPLIFLGGLLVFCLLAVAVYNFPPVNERLAWRVAGWRSDIQYFFNPPEAVVFTPQQQAQIDPTQVEAMVQATLQALVQQPTATLAPATETPVINTPEPTFTPSPSPTPLPTLPPPPASASLKGVIHEYQKWNNCGPATLSMALSYWDWQGDQRDTAAFMKPNQRDKNVMPYEMQDFIASETSLKSLVRQGGDLETLKRLIAAGFPVIVEKGFPVAKEGWMGHYEVLTGYDDARQRFMAQDSYIQADLPVAYDELQTYWQHFNYIYLVIYPPERENELMTLLGPQADEVANLQYAAQKASDEIFALSGEAQYFAWFNRGTSLMRLGDYAGAATAYDQAFTVYATLPEEDRPWRMLWYQTGPYFAYYYSGRYYDAISLATTTIVAASEPAIEESFYWRGLSRLAVGDSEGAIADFRDSLKWHPDFAPSLAQLSALGVTP